MCALCFRDQICDKYILNKHAERCVLMYLGIWKYHFISLFFLWVNFPKERAPQIDASFFGKSRPEIFFFMICQTSLYILLPFYKAQAQ